MYEKDMRKLNKGIRIEELVESFARTGSYRETARELGCDPANASRRLRRHFAVKSGQRNTDHDIPNYAPGAGRVVTSVSKALDKHGEVKAIHVREQAQDSPENFAHPLDKLKRVSTYRGADGEIRGQWEITVADDNGEKAAFDEIMEAMKEDLPRYEPVAAPDSFTLSANLCNLYVLTDAHIGSLAWYKESGADWDLKIAEHMLVAAFDHMITHANPADECVLALLGDWTHYDKLTAETTLSGNVLDSDGRQPKMNKAAIRIARKIVEMALDKHTKVTLLIAEGNHDIIAAPWLREVFIAAYEKEPRLHIIDDPRPYYVHMVGDVMLGFHHGHLKGGHTVKDATALVAIFADEYRKEWGEASHVYIHSGNYHTKEVTQPRGAEVIQHPTLATRDSWTARRGWDNIRRAICTTYHVRHGERGGNEVGPEMLQGL